MTIKFDGFGPHSFPAVESVDTNFADHAVEVILSTRIKGAPMRVVINLTEQQAGKLAKLLADFVSP